VPTRREHLHDLATLMDADDPGLDFLDPLGEKELVRLHELVAGSLRAEEQRVDEALRATMRFLPRPLRGRAGKILFPEGHP
jgi:hypothetical protein